MSEKIKNDRKTFRRGSQYMTNHPFNGVDIGQRMHDGFINATSMCVAHGKDLNDWFTRKETFSLFLALARWMSIQPNLDPQVLDEVKAGDFRNLEVSRLSASKYEKIFPGLVVSRRGSPDTGGGTWVYPRLAIQLAQWCSSEFALLVSFWVEEWLTSSYNPIQLEADADRVRMRDELKDVKRIELTDQIKTFLEKAGKYDPSSWATRGYFSSAHDKLNVILTGETAQAMRSRIQGELDRVVSEKELIRDYFPIQDLVNYASLCQAAANEMALNGTPPLDAIEIAARQVLSLKYQPKPINFTERIDLVRRRLEQRDQLLLGGAIPILGEVA